ncbi:MAG: prepilin-type N-terminal cleavage/methylation domain-containing protein [Pseudomonadota bacterium]
MSARPTGPGGAAQRRPPRATADRGFTLLELLVAVVLLGLVGAMAAGGISFGLAASARPIRLRTASRLTPVFFEGRADAVALVGRLPSSLAPPEDRLIALSIEGRPGARRLVLRSVPIGDRRPQIDRSAPGLTVLEGLAEGGFAYHGPDPALDPALGRARWRENWAGEAQLPTRLRLRLAWPGARARPPLDVTAAVGAAIPD